MQFHNSEALTFGLELELQIVAPGTGRLAPMGAVLHQALQKGAKAHCFAMEATLSTIEVNSSVHHDAASMLEEVLALVAEARAAARLLGCDLRGGGTQMTQFWNERVTSPSLRARALESRFGFLPKRFSTYGMHVHVGMPNPDAAIRVANAMQALCPLFIALAAASPFLQLADTGFAAARPLEPLVYPNGGPMPWLRDWQHLEQVTQELFSTGIAQSLKDIYWDVRPKPEFGTVEVRVFDTPLSVRKAVALAAFTRSVAALLLGHHLVLPDRAQFETTNQRVSRFLACRDGMLAQLFNPFASSWVSATEWFEQLMADVERFDLFPDDAQTLQALRVLLQLETDYTAMRSAWARLAPTTDNPQDIEHALSDYCAAMCGKLLEPLRV